MPSDNPNITLAGSEDIFSRYSHLNSSQKELLNEVAHFVYENPLFLNLLERVFREIYNADLYTDLLDEIMELESEFYDTNRFGSFRQILEKFFENTPEIDNDRGKVLEIICLLAVAKMFDRESCVVNCHCKVTVRYDGTSFTTGDVDIDVCGIDNRLGRYIESKRGILGEDEVAKNKLEVLGELSEHLRKVCLGYEYDHVLKVFVLTFDDSRKMEYYRNKFPNVDFLGIESFIDDYCKQS